MKHNIRMEYKNIILRPLEQEDIEYLREWRNDEKNTKYLRKIGYISEEQQKKWYEGYLVNEDEYTFAIEERCELNRIVGSASLYGFNNGQVEFGKILIGDSEAHGKKIGCHTTEAISSIAFDYFNCKKVILRCFVENKGACYVYKQAGFCEVDSYITSDGQEEVFMELTKGNL